MYVVDTTLSSGTRVTKESSLQRLVFPLPPELQRKVLKNQRKWMGKEAAALAPLPWNRDGMVTFTYSTSSQRSQPLFCDRRDEPLPRRSRQQIHTCGSAGGCGVAAVHRADRRTAADCAESLCCR